MATLRTAIHLLLTYLLTDIPCAGEVIAAESSDADSFNEVAYLL